MPRLNFDATQVEPDTSYELLPAAWYNAAMQESSMVATKDGTSEYLQCSFRVLDGKYANRMLFDRFHINNASVQAREIAYKQLSAIGHAAGVLHIADSEQLHGIPIKIRVRIRKDASGQYDDQNEISGYKSVADGGDAAPAWAGQQQPAAAAPAKATPAAQPQKSAEKAAASAAPAAAANKPPWLQ